ncbi:MAG: CinA family protein [Candidatus Dormiibacterota bacterium]
MGETRASGSDPVGPVLATAFPDAASLGARLLERGMTIAVAESCTGGLLGAALTATAGSSAFVRGGVIAYADDVKADHLGVGRHLLATHGAVSPEVAAAMAAGVRERFGATIGVGITGVAGPAASEHKPAGLVFVAVALADTERVIRIDEDQGREANRANAVHAALALCATVIGPSAPDGIEP